MTGYVSALLSAGGDWFFVGQLHAHRADCAMEWVQDYEKVYVRLMSEL